MVCGRAREIMQPTLLRGEVSRMPEHHTNMITRSGQPLIGVIVQEDGEEMVRYTTDEEEAETPARQTSVERALQLAGAWSDLDWDEAEKELDRIRHESKPTPPITDL